MKKKLLSSEDVKRLNYVKVANPKLDVSPFPDFMIIGPQRTGTTWLYKNLTQHPQVSMSHEKEPHFFSFMRWPNHELFKSDSLAWYLELFQDGPYRYLRKAMKHLRENRSLYRPVVRGEASATYAMMEEAAIQDIVTINPDIKCILMIRNPVERAWSHLFLHLMREGLEVSRLSESEIESYLEEPYVRDAGFYSELIRKWESLIGEENLFVGVFDDITKAPDKLLMMVCVFLGIKSKAKYINNRNLRRKVNPSKKTDIPERYEKMLKETYSEEIENLNASFDLSWE